MTMRPFATTHCDVVAQFHKIEQLAITTLDFIDPTVARSVRVAATTNLGNSEAMFRMPPDTVAIGESDLAAVAGRFAEQFVIDVTGIDDELRAEVGAAFGASTFALAQAVYVIDVFQRARIAFVRLFGAVPEAAASVVAANDADLWIEIEAFMRSVALLDGVDPVVTELVRLRGARVHQCRLCQSRLSVAAVDIAGDQQLFGAGDTNVTDSRQRVAVEFADALVTQPSLLNDVLIGQCRTYFTDDELVEIVFDVVRNAANKIAVAFGADAPVAAGGIEYFVVDALGDVVANVDINALR